MNIQELKKILEKSDDKFNIFKDRNTLSQYNFSVQELINLINDFLSDEQKAGLFELEHFKKLSSSIKAYILRDCFKDNIILELLENSDVVADLKNYEVVKIVKSLSDDSKISVLHNSKLFQKYGIEDFEIQEIIKSLDENKKKELLSDKKFAEQGLHLGEFQISNIIADFESEETKLELIDLYKFENYVLLHIVKTFSDKTKTAIVIEGKYGFDEHELKTIISTLSVDSIANFIRDNKEFFTEQKINVYEITMCLEKEKQLDLVSRIEDMELSLGEKRKILATLSQEAKSEVNISEFPQEYITAIQMQLGGKYNEKIVVDFSKNLEIYIGFDELIPINPLELSNEEREKLIQLCEICTKIKIKDDLDLSSSTAEEYINGEIWINSVLQRMNPEWSDIQKIAFIDNAIGKKISYSPDFDTEISNMSDARALWKIIHSGYGVCNGIAQVEKYILSKIGIEAEMVSSEVHTFLKLKGIELPNSNGEMIKGDTILDPTWNLAAQRYGARPTNFCKGYEEIRKHDIRDDGTDTECHKNDEELASATLELDEQNLRKIFKSIGLADKDGNFPIKELIDKSNTIADYNLQTEEAIKRQFLLLAEYCPEFARCQNSTSNILQGVLLNHENLNFNSCVVNRVYEREDESKRPVLYVYVDLPTSGKSFYVADSNIGQFFNLTQQEFEARFECYKSDMEKQGGHRPWEDIQKAESIEDLSRSSGNIIASEENER